MLRCFISQLQFTLLVARLVPVLSFNATIVINWAWFVCMSEIKTITQNACMQLCSFCLNAIELPHSTRDERLALEYS